MSKTIIFLLFIIFISLLLLGLFYPSGTSSKTSVVIHVYEQNNTTRKTNLSKQEEIISTEDESYTFSKSDYLNHTRKFTQNAVGFLVASITGNTQLGYNPYPVLREKILKLDERLGDNCSADLIIFHTGYPFRRELILIIEATTRHVEFVNVDQIFYKFSPSFEPYITDPTWSQKGKWNYHHMCRFWFKLVFELKIVQRYRYFMRLDDDSQILGKWSDVFKLMSERQAVYMANQREVDFEYILPGITRLRNLTTAYINKNHLTIRNSQALADVFNHTIQVPNYWNNFEIVDLTFIRRKDVLDFTETVDKSNGIFLYRWGDAPLRYVTLALFANASEVLHRVKLDLGYCHPC